MKQAPREGETQLDVALVSPPYDYPPRPSFALSLFKQCLNEAGMRSRVYYPMFRLCHLLGHEAVNRLASFPLASGIQELMLAHMTDVENPYDNEAFSRFLCRQCPREEPEALLELLRFAEDCAGRCIEETAQQIAACRPGVLAVSSIFSQVNGALALIRRVKELSPGTVSILGGGNVSGEAGVAVLRNYPSVDYVFFGEGDEVFAQVCRIAMGLEKGPMPYGVVRRGEAVPSPVPHRMTADMNTVCYPDYSDFLDAWNREQAGEFGPSMFGPHFPFAELAPIYQPGPYYTLFLEGSRGCWWGQKHPCSFCGLNGRKNVYRAKTPERLFDEILTVSQRFGSSFIQLTDNILSHDAMNRLLPMLRDCGREIHLLGEVKTNLREKDIRNLVDAGFLVVQPGIESLNDHLLELMGKGNNAAAHVALLKQCRRNGLGLVWNILYGIPGERQEDYEELLRLIPMILHFQPPTGANPVLLQRYSRYWEDPASYGLELVPYEMYRYILGGSEERIHAMCLYYDLVGGSWKEERSRMQPWYDRLRAAVRHWISAEASGRKWGLEMTVHENGIFLRDTRPCRVLPFTMLTGAEKDVLLAVDEPLSEKELTARLADRWSPQELGAALKTLIELRFAVCLGGRYVSLALPAKEK